MNIITFSINTPQPLSACRCSFSGGTKGGAAKNKQLNKVPFRGFRGKNTFLSGLKYLCVFLLILSNCTKEDFFDVKEVVLTVDDAPGFPEQTRQMLDVLNKHHVQATFFCVGSMLKENAELAGRLASEQYLGNHTYMHTKLIENDLKDIYKSEIFQTQQLIDRLQPGNKRYFRPPYSGLSIKQKLTLQNNGFDIVMWDLGAEDWDDNVSSDEIIEYYHENLGFAASIPVIAFHLTNSSVEALDVLLTEFEWENIKVITLDEYRSRK